MKCYLKEKLREAVVRRCSFLISQILEENNWLESLFDKAADLQAPNFIKKGPQHR